jgi:Glucosidase II beta subunit-like
MRSFIAVLCCVALTSVTAIEFKGVPESLMEQYNAAAPVHSCETCLDSLGRSSWCVFLQNFKCLNGGELMPITQVNDNFCDCPDGSDEPGTCTSPIFEWLVWAVVFDVPPLTAACANGRFYCINKGFKGEFIPSARVEDGICGEKLLFLHA